MPQSSSRKKRKVKKTVTSGVVHIHSTFNNTIVTVTDVAGNVLSWASAGSVGFKGTKKSTPYAAQKVSEAAAKPALDFHLKTVEVHVKGPGPGRDAAVRSVEAVGLEITAIKDVTPLPHNGCRPPKRPRG